MTYLLDTNVIITQIRTNTPFTFEEDAQLAISVVTYSELLYGAQRKSRAAEEQLHKLLASLDVSFLPVTKENARIFCQIKIQLEKAGLKLEDFDLLIAATALEQDLTLVTANKKHFARIPNLKLL